MEWTDTPRNFFHSTIFANNTNWLLCPRENSSAQVGVTWISQVVIERILDQEETRLEEFTVEYPIYLLIRIVTQVDWHIIVATALELVSQFD